MHSQSWPSLMTLCSICQIKQHRSLALNRDLYPRLNALGRIQNDLTHNLGYLIYKCCFKLTINKTNCTKPDTLVTILVNLVNSCRSNLADLVVNVVRFPSASSFLVGIHLLKVRGSNLGQVLGPTFLPEVLD